MNNEDSKDDQPLKVPILSKLFRRDLWGGSYTTIQNCLSKIPVHRRGEGRNKLDELNQKGWVLFHKRGKCVSLNPSAKEEIESFLRDHLPDYFF